MEAKAETKNKPERDDRYWQTRNQEIKQTNPTKIQNKQKTQRNNTNQKMEKGGEKAKEDRHKISKHRETTIKK